MPFESAIIRAAEEQLTRRRQEQEQEYTQRKTIVYEQIPRVQGIERQLRQMVMLAATTALKKGQDPKAAIELLEERSLALKKERGELLSEYGYPEDYLVKKPVCPKCQDRGWKGAEMCGCLKSLCTQEQNKQLSSLLDLQGQSFESFRLDYYGAPFDFDRRTMEKIFNFCQNYAANFATIATRNMVFYGTVGVGKTFLSAAIARQVSNQGFSVVYDTASNIFYQFEMDKFARDGEAQRAVKRYLNADLLILDDLGSEMITPFVQTTLYRIVNERLVRNRSTIISTNFSPEEIGVKYSKQIASRLAGEYLSMVFRGPDIRQKKKQFSK